jgi:tetratricopeptide (TPR) repeat protein
MRAAGAACAALLVLAGCGGLPQRPAGLPERVELSSVPFHPQVEYQCGPAALATLLQASGASVSPEALVGEVYLPGRRGSLQAELVAATRRHGRVPYVLAPEPEALYAELAAGRPAVVLQNFGSRRSPEWHYAVAIGYEPGRVLLRSGLTERQAVRESRFLGTWYRGDSWALLALRPGELPATATPRRYLEAVAGLEATGRAAEAAVSFEAAAQRWPHEASAWLGLGNARLVLGDAAAAERAFAAALDAAPTHAAARNNYAELLARRGCLAAARVQIARAVAAARGTPLEEAVLRTQRELDARPAAREPAGCPVP